MTTPPFRALIIASAALLCCGCAADGQADGVPDTASFSGGGAPELDTESEGDALATEAIYDVGSEGDAATDTSDTAVSRGDDGSAPSVDTSAPEPEDTETSDGVQALDTPTPEEDADVIACTPDCAGAQCGPDGCGGSCGDCVPGQLCSQGTCIDPGTCNAACDGKTCGPDGCGGICGYCTYPEVCDPNGQCVEVCVPSCDGKFCGADGCGGACGLCEAPLLCGSDGLCYQPGCVPSCAGKVCGGDGCGGDCGICAEPKICQSGTCQLGPCGTVTSVGECQGNVVVWCSEGVFLLDDDCDEYTDHDCTYDGFSNSYACKPVGPCTPKCEGKSCGSDACGGWCGLCPDGWSCLAGSCAPEQGADCGGEITTLGECIEGVLWFCSLEKLYSVQCIDTGQSCMWDQSQGEYGCL
jgi:hypothetical protein